MTRVRTAVARAAGLLALVALAMPSPDAVAEPAGLAFGPSGLGGAGFVNVVAYDPSGSGGVLAGGDVSGFHRSDDGGRTWHTANTGLSDKRQLAVATIAFAHDTPGLVYAGVGAKGNGGGLLVSTDDGDSWTMRSTVPQFSGVSAGAGTALPKTHPRSTGSLIALDETNGFIYAATYKKGLMRSADGGTTWTTLGLAGTFLRALAIDPADPDVLYVGTFGGGIWKTTTASGAGTLSRLPTSPPNAEELLVLGDHVYVAAEEDGILRSDDGGAHWAQLGEGVLPLFGPEWQSIAGYHACDRDVVIAGNNAGAANALAISTDGGATWAFPLADPSTIHTSLAGPVGETWWLAQRADAMLGGVLYTASQIAIDPSAPPGDDCLKPTALVAGRAGVWGTTNADTATDWYPMASGLSVTIARDVLADPITPGAAYAAIADWTFVGTDDRFATVGMYRPPGGSAGIEVAVDEVASPGRILVASGDRQSNTKGEVWSTTSPLSGPTWTDENLSNVASNKRPLALAARTIGSQRIVIAAVSGSGIWRKVGATWTKVNGTAMTTVDNTRSASLVWPEGSALVYLYDHATGVWRSTDNGQSWTKIWARPSKILMTGYLAVDPAAPGRLYVSVGKDGVYRIENAGAGTVAAGTLTPVRIGSFITAGAIDHGADGALYVARLAAPGVAPGLFRSFDRGATWQNVADDSYRAAAGFVYDLAVAPDGTVYLALNGNGVLVGTPAA